MVEVEEKDVKIEPCDFVVWVETGSLAYPVYGVKEEVVKEVLFEVFKRHGWTVKEDKVCWYKVQGRNLEYLDEVIDEVLGTLDVMKRFLKDECYIRF